MLHAGWIHNLLVQVGWILTIPATCLRHAILPVTYSTIISIKSILSAVESISLITNDYIMKTLWLQELFKFLCIYCDRIYLYTRIYSYISTVGLSTFVSSMNTTSSDTTHLSFVKSVRAGCILIFVILIGSLGNLSIIFSILRRNLQKINYYYFVLHLAICDLFTLLGAIRKCYRFLTGNDWITSAVSCKLSHFTGGQFYLAGAYFMVLISALRYRAVFHPLRLAVSRWKLHFSSAILYVVAFLYQIPAVLVYNFTPPDKCFKEWPLKALRTTYKAFQPSVHYVIPVVVIGLTYMKICHELVKQSEKIKSMNTTVALTGEDKERWLFQRLAHHRNSRTFVISFFIFVCFFVAGFPRNIEYVLVSFKIKPMSGYYHWVTIMYYFGVSAVNPIIYGVFDNKLFPSFRRWWKKQNVNTRKTNIKFLNVRQSWQWDKMVAITWARLLLHWKKRRNWENEIENNSWNSL